MKYGKGVAIGMIFLIAAGVLVTGSLPACAGNGNGVPPDVIGNRLSFPVIWAEGVEKALPGTSGMDPELGDWVYWWGPPLEDGTLQSCEPETEEGYEYYCEDGDDNPLTLPSEISVLPPDGWQPVYPQQNAENTWQAGSASADASTVIGDITIGNLLVPRAYPTDGVANVFVVNTHMLSDGMLTSIQTYNQPLSGPNTFNAYVLRPTIIPNEYTVIFDSGPLYVLSVAAGQIETFAVGPIEVHTGDLIAHYGRGIPLDIGQGTDTTLYPASPAPSKDQVITLGTDYPIYSTDRTYSIAATVNSGGPTGRVVVDWIDWGDSIESVDWTTNSKVRLEVVLLKDLTNPMLEYTMNHIYGWGIDEMWGLAATGDPVNNDPAVEAQEGPGTQATVYSHCARQTIQKLLVERNDPRLADLVWTWDVYTDESGNPEPGWAEWDAENEVYVSPSDLISDIVLFNGAVHEAEGEGSGDYYSAEINVKGKIMYGYTWSVRDLHDNSGGSQAGEGYYRVTFSLDETCGDVTRNTDFIDPDTQIFIPIEEEAVTILAESDDSDSGDTGGGVAVIDYGNSLLYRPEHPPEKQSRWKITF